MKDAPIATADFSMKLIQRLQNSLLTRWCWKTFQHEETGYLALIPIWKKTPSGYFKCKFRE